MVLSFIMLIPENRVYVYNSIYLLPISGRTIESYKLVTLLNSYSNNFSTDSFVFHMWIMIPSENNKLCSFFFNPYYLQCTVCVCLCVFYIIKLSSIDGLILTRSIYNEHLYLVTHKRYF